MAMPQTSRELGEFGEQQLVHRLQHALGGYADRQMGQADRGIDLTFHFESVAVDKTTLLFAAQAKTGRSHVRNDGNRLQFVRLDKRRFDEWRRSNVPVMLAWIDPDEGGECYWTLITDSSDSRRVSVSKLSRVSPATAVDLTLALHRPAASGQKGRLRSLEPRLTTGVRKTAKQYYRTELSREKPVNPLVGEVAFSWAGWKHLTRKKRPRSFILQSLLLLPVARIAIEHPDKFVAIRRVARTNRGRWTTEIRLLVFDSVFLGLTQGSRRRRIRVVLREQVKYPDDWWRDAAFREKTDRTVSFWSIYEKDARAQ